MTIQYGVLTAAVLDSVPADETITECASLAAAHDLAAREVATGLYAHVVELGGTGPVYASDGDKIADTHAPRRTIQTYAPSAGRINPEWLSGARCNQHDDETVEVWFGLALNAAVVEIDDEGSVWVAEGQSGGRWLSQAKIDDTCERIDRGF